MCMPPQTVKQDAALLTHMTVTQCKRRRPRVDDEEKQRSRGISVKYSILKEDKSEVPVCQPTFLSIFGIKKDRVQNIAKYWLQTGQARPENRGGARNREKHNLKKERIRTHISTFTCRASHYARREAPGRKYLPSDLSVAKMHKMFIDQNHEQVSYTLYWSVFVYDFNLAFGHPAKDICSTCVKFRMQIKNPELSEEEKREQITLFMFHRRRAHSFYNIRKCGNRSPFSCFIDAEPISDARVLQVAGEKIGFKPSYAGDFCLHAVLKRGQKWSQFQPTLAPDINCVKPAKKNDVLKLLDELGVNLAVQNFYENALCGVHDQNGGIQDLEDSDNN
ncbi:uncharacterized protein LOC121373208 [Gigantopelta aegis]|uniref:uncharacterized protein LOC121373208 n=1 Tax=Gigantopelta aegis TaxID=1735272 RepID=UPI001B88CDA5|nr:uncharacterized protein LOC121373208 [Gigantopelta aegis]